MEASASSSKRIIAGPSVDTRLHYDALSNETTYEYNERNWLITVTQPDPDGAGSLTSPVTSYDYDAVGNVTSLGKEYLGDNITYAYDAYGRKTSETWGNIGGGSDHKHDT